MVDSGGLHFNDDAGSPAASKLDSLLQRLQVPSDPTAPGGRAAEQSAFHQLGRQLCQERHGSQPASTSQIEAAAREYLHTSAAKVAPTPQHAKQSSCPVGGQGSPFVPSSRERHARRRARGLREP